VEEATEELLDSQDLRSSDQHVTSSQANGVSILVSQNIESCGSVAESCEVSSNTPFYVILSALPTSKVYLARHLLYL
jgi:hypothetical protein